MSVGVVMVDTPGWRTLGIRSRLHLAPLPSDGGAAEGTSHEAQTGLGAAGLRSAGWGGGHGGGAGAGAGVNDVAGARRPAPLKGKDQQPKEESDVALLVRELLQGLQGLIVVFVRCSPLTPWVGAK